MNSKVAFIFGTIIGAGIGVAGTYSYFKDKYEKLAEEDFNSRRAFDEDKKDETEENDFPIIGYKQHNSSSFVWSKDRDKTEKDK